MLYNKFVLVFSITLIVGTNTRIVTMVSRMFVYGVSQIIYIYIYMDTEQIIIIMINIFKNSKFITKLFKII